MLPNSHSESSLLIWQGPSQGRNVMNQRELVDRKINDTLDVTENFQLTPARLRTPYRGEWGGSVAQISCRDPSISSCSTYKDIVLFLNLIVIA